MKGLILLTLVLSALVSTVPTSLLAQDSQRSSLHDVNGDGLVSALAFGDSITRGVGDGLSPGATSPENIIDFIGPGYPGRVQALLNIPVDNEGVPGEDFTTQGIFRLPGSVGRSTADYVLLFEGINDSSRAISDAEIERKMQRAVNTIRILGKEPLLGTYFATTGDHASLVPIAAGYTNTIRQLAVSNDCSLMDFEKAFRTTCKNKVECELLNLPEGLHPNTAGYRVMAEVVSAALLGIDLFAPAGAADLAGALGVPVTDIMTQPEPVSVVPVN